MKLSVIIPVFNEEKTVARVLAAALRQDLGSWEKEIIVIDDHSTDRTHNILKQFLDQVKIFRHGSNQGKGAALKTGFAAASGDAIIVQDADLEYEPADWPRLLQALGKDPEASAVLGSRELDSKRRGYLHYVFGVRFLAWLINSLFKSKLTDPYTCYKLIRSQALKDLKLQSNGFEIEAEIVCKLLKQNKKIIEAPINYYPRSFAQGKKIRAKDGLIAMITIIKYYFA